MEKDAMYRGKEDAEEQEQEKRLAPKVEELYNDSRQQYGTIRQHRRLPDEKQE